MLRAGHNFGSTYNRVVAISPEKSVIFSLPKNDSEWVGCSDRSVVLGTGKMLSNLDLLRKISLD